MRKQSTNNLNLPLKFKALSVDQMTRLKGGCDNNPPTEEERADIITIIIVDDINA